MFVIDIFDLFIVDYGVRNIEFVWEDEDIVNDELYEVIDIFLLISCNDLMNNLYLVFDDSIVLLEEDYLLERL